MIVQSLDELAARHRLDTDRDGLDVRRAAGAAFHDALTQSILSQRVRQPLMTESSPGQYWLADLYPIPGSPLDVLIRKTEALILVREKRIRARKTIDHETYTRVIRSHHNKSCLHRNDKAGRADHHFT